jgi:uncharacterized repeat protein (TIGR03943 family)
VTRADRGLLVALTGTFAVWIAHDQLLNRFLRPGMQPWLMLAGGALVGVGGLDAWLGRRSGGAAVRRSWVGWLLLLPLCVTAVVRPGPLGAYAAGRQVTVRTFDSGGFDLEQALRAGSFAGQSPEIRVVDFVTAAQSRESRPLLVGQSVRVTGFVAEDAEDDGSFVLARFFVGCCAGDAVAFSIDVVGWRGAAPKPDDWIEVEGTFAGRGSGDLTYVPRLRAIAVRHVDQPDEPYEAPR